MSVLTIDKNNFESKVMNSSQPVLIDFWAPWCGPCKMVSPIVDEIAEELTNVAVCKINVDEEPELASKFNIMSIPSIVVIKEGKETARSVGARPKSAIIEMLDK